MTKKIEISSFLRYKSILYIGENDFTYKKVKANLYFYMNSFDFSESCYSLKESLKYDLIIIDVNSFEKDNLNYVSSRYVLQTPVIFLASQLDDELINSVENINLKNILLKQTQLDDISLYVKLVLKESKKVFFDKNFYYCLKSNKLFQNQKNISLTTLESKLLEILIRNKNEIVSYEKIENFVWSSRGCSRFSMRNIVNKIRDKTYPQIIKNISNQGYIISNKNFFE